MKHAFEMGCNPMWKKVQREEDEKESFGMHVASYELELLFVEKVVNF